MSRRTKKPKNGCLQKRRGPYTNIRQPAKQRHGRESGQDHQARHAKLALCLEAETVVQQLAERFEHHNT